MAKPGKNKGKKRWQKEEIEWGMSLAPHYGVSPGSYDDWDDWDDDDGWDDDDYDDDDYDDDGPEDHDDDEPDWRPPLIERLRRAVPEGASHSSIVPGSTEDELVVVITAAGQLEARIRAAADSERETLEAEVGQIQTQVQEISDRVEERRREGQRIQEDLAKLAPPPEGATGDEAAELTKAIGAVEDCFSGFVLSELELTTAKLALSEAQALFETIAEAGAERLKEHKRIAEEGVQVPDLGYLPDQKTDMGRAREAFNKALEDPITDERNQKAQEALDELRRVSDRIKDELEALGDEAGIKDLCAAAGVSEDEFAKLETDLGGRAKLAEHLKTFDAKTLGGLCKSMGGADKLNGILTGVGGAAELKKIIDGLGKADAVVALVDEGNLDGARLKKLCEDLSPSFTAELLSGGVKPADVVQLHAAFGGDVSHLTNLAKDAGLDAKPKALVALFTKGCGGDAGKFKALCEGFSDKEDRKKLKGLVEDGGLGDAPDALGELLGTGCDGDPKALIQLGKSFEKKSARDGLKRMLTDGGLAGKPGALADGDIDPKCLAMMLKHAAGPAAHGFAGDDVERRSDALATLFTNMDEDACKALKTTLSDGGLGQAPDALGHAIGIGCGGDAAQLKAFTGAFKDDPGPVKLKQMLTDGGLTGKSGKLEAGDIDPKCLGQILKHGGGPNPGDANARMGKMANLIKGLEKTDCEALKDVLGEGGLGQAPEPLGHLIGVGCDGDPAKLKATIGAFDDAPKRKGLAKMLKKGGLDSSEVGGDGKPKADPKCLAQLLKHSGGPRLATATDPEDTRRAKALATLCTGMGDVGCDALKEVLEDSGLGKDPVVLGHLVGIGCKGDGTKLEALTTELNKGTNKANLTDLLQKGGLGTRDDANAPTGTDAKCLANLFEPGSDGDPAELVKLMKALSDTTANPNALSDLKGVMTKGALGHHPEVLGSLYKHGCLNDATGPADGTGAKDPKILIDMVGEFRGDTEAAKFGELLAAGGFAKRGKTNVGGRDIHRDRLASVMRYGFTPKGGTKPDGKKLKGLYDAFKDHSGDHLADLDSMLDAMETAEDWILKESKAKEPNQPGMGLQNVLNASGHSGNVAQLHSKFYTQLKTNQGGGVIGGVQRLTLEELIQHAASFEHTDPTNPNGLADLHAISTPIAPHGQAATNFRVGHAACRHTRKHNDFRLGGINSTTPVSLFPRTVTETELTEMSKTALEGFPGHPAYGRQHNFGPTHANASPWRDPANHGAGQKRNPPQDAKDLNGNYTYYDPVTSTYTHPETGAAETVPLKIGFNPDPSDASNPQKSYMGQLFPRGGTHVVQVTTRDMHAIKGALT
ncbi:MAG: hypothetical protein AB3N22_14280 [Ruegeria sp.]